MLTLFNLPPECSEDVWQSIGRLDGVRFEIRAVHSEIESLLIWLCSWNDRLEAFMKRVERMESIA